MLTIITLILAIAFLLYTLLGGADFGAGIIETFAGRRGQQTISRAIAPVWEANHVWLILAVVILFTGFPRVYASLSMVLHIPLMLVLLGIIFRGTAFTFRHYDVQRDRTHRYYTFFFKASSFITPVFLGVTLGAMILGRITLDPAGSFYAVYMAPWLNPFCFTLGIFSASLFAYIAAVFLVGEAPNQEERARYQTLARRSMLLTILTGLLVFVAAELEGHHLFREFLQSTFSITALLLASLFVPLILRYLKGHQTALLRTAIGIQVSAILLGWFAIQYPVLIYVQDGRHLTVYNTQAPASTLSQLLIALIVGLLLVIPGFLYLFRVFKVNGRKSTQPNPPG